MSRGDRRDGDGRNVGPPQGELAVGGGESAHASNRPEIPSGVLETFGDTDPSLLQEIIGKLKSTGFGNPLFHGEFREPLRSGTVSSVPVLTRLTFPVPNFPYYVQIPEGKNNFKKLLESVRALDQAGVPHPYLGLVEWTDWKKKSLKGFAVEELPPLLWPSRSSPGKDLSFVAIGGDPPDTSVISRETIEQVEAIKNSLTSFGVALDKFVLGIGFESVLVFDPVVRLGEGELIGDTFGRLLGKLRKIVKKNEANRSR